MHNICNVYNNMLCARICATYAQKNKWRVVTNRLYHNWRGMAETLFSAALLQLLRQRRIACWFMPPQEALRDIGMTTHGGKRPSADEICRRTANLLYAVRLRLYRWRVYHTHYTPPHHTHTHLHFHISSYYVYLRVSWYVLSWDSTGL